MNFRYRADGTRQHRARRDHRTRTTSRRSSTCSRARLAGRRGADSIASARRARPSTYPAGAGAHLGVSDAPGVQHASLRVGDDALHPQPRAQGHRPRHLDDPARLVHDEAERGVGDAADHLARVLEAAPVRAGRTGGRAISRSSASSKRRCARSPALPPCRCSRTPARRASSPG